MRRGEVVSTYLDRPLAAQLRALADAEGETLGGFVRKVLQERVERERDASVEATEILDDIAASVRRPRLVFR